jgi:hypothetical protein
MLTKEINWRREMEMKKAKQKKKSIESSVVLLYIPENKIRKSKRTQQNKGRQTSIRARSDSMAIAVFHIIPDAFALNLHSKAMLGLQQKRKTRETTASRRRNREGRRGSRRRNPS